MKKKILFLDGDGTLWYPKTTKRTQKPHWIYDDPLTKDRYLEHLELTPMVKETLEILRQRGIYLVVISANPHVEDVALKELSERLEHFGLMHLFHSYRASEGHDPLGKAAIILDVIKELNLTKEDALMIGDSYYYDYDAPRKAGIDAFFIENEVSTMPEVTPADLQTIREVSDLIAILE